MKGKSVRKKTQAQAVKVTCGKFLQMLKENPHNQRF